MNNTFGVRGSEFGEVYVKIREEVRKEYEAREKALKEEYEERKAARERELEKLWCQGFRNLRAESKRSMDRLVEVLMETGSLKSHLRILPSLLLGS